MAELGLENQMTDLAGFFIGAGFALGCYFLMHGLDSLGSHLRKKNTNE